MYYDFSSIKKGIDGRIEKGILPGAVLCVNLNGERVYDYCGGFSDVENKKPLCSDAIFRLCSMTKPITAVAALVQQDRGKLNVRDEVKKYLPQFANRKVGALRDDGKVRIVGDASRDITIQDILRHGSGLGSGPVGDAAYPIDLRTKTTSLAQMVDAYADMPLDFSPGEGTFYSALTAFDVVARIVEITSDMPYEDFIKKNIFEPLGMTDTFYVPSEARLARLVPMYRLSDNKDSITRLPFTEAHQGFPFGSISGCTGLMSTLNDYSRFAEMLCGEGEYKGVRVLSRQAVRDMRTPGYPIGFGGVSEFFNWGYGVRVCSESKTDVQELTGGSFGWSGAYNTHFWVDPELKLTAVLMSNLDNAGGSASETAFEFECNVMRSLR